MRFFRPGGSGKKVRYLSFPVVSSSPQVHEASNAGASDRIEAHVWRIAGVVILGMVMSILDTTIVNVALSTLGHDLHSSISQIQWVVTGYLLALAAVIPVTGWASRRFGAKRVYMTSLVLFTARLGAVRGRRVGHRASSSSASCRERAAA